MRLSGIVAWATLALLPRTVRLRMGRTHSAPGSAPDARRIFINEATNGTPMKSGRTLDLGLDAVLPRGDRNLLYVGLRHSRFKANFKFVGGNEDFDVTSTHWGIASGLERAYTMGQRTDLILSGGLEYYRSARLSGHDTSYSPDGENVNPRQDYSYTDADQAVSQPKLRPVVVVGIRRRLGR